MVRWSYGELVRVVVVLGSEGLTEVFKGDAVVAVPIVAPEEASDL